MGIISFHISSSLSQKKVYGPSMVMKHRKLFPTSTNETDCPEICYTTTTTTCPYGCYPYPDFYVFPPPPPTPLPPISTDQSRQNLSSHLIIIASVLASFFLLLGYYLIIVKCCSGRTRLESDGQDVEFLDENQEPAIDHPIWFINTIGLQPSVITKITVFKYRKSDVLVEGTVCSVCLSEFQEDETLRLLPKCNHAFHIPCIDTWLRSHTNCPLCRAGIISNNWTASNPSASDEQNALNLRSQEETQIENPERSDQVGDITEETGGGNGLIHVDGERKEVDGSKDQNQMNLMPEEGTPIENSKSNGELGESMAETESEIEVPHIDDNITGFEDSKDGGNSNGGGVFCVAELEVRRTASMDLSSAVTGNSAYRRQDLPESNMGIVQMQDLGNSKMERVIGSDSTRQWAPVSLKRSSSSGGSMFLPRHNSKNLSFILPL